MKCTIHYKGCVDIEFFGHETGFTCINPDFNIQFHFLVTLSCSKTPCVYLLKSSKPALFICTFSSLHTSCFWPAWSCLSCQHYWHLCKSGLMWNCWQACVRWTVALLVARNDTFKLNISYDRFRTWPIGTT